MSMTNMIARFKALWGTFSDSSGTVDGEIRQLFRKHIHYEFPHALKAAAVANPATRMEAQTASVSNSQPLGERVIYIADKPCIIREITFAQAVSSTVTATYTMAWTLQVIKRTGGTGGLLSATLTATQFVGGLTSCTGAGSHSFTGSYSQIRTNVAFAPNKLCLTKSATKYTLNRGDVLTTKVRKGSGTATDSGALFRGGLLKITAEES